MFRLLRRSTVVDRWCHETAVLFNRVVEFYFNVMEQHQEILDLKAKEALTSLEALTHRTRHNQTPAIPLDSVLDKIPAVFRRAAINVAVGTAQSFHSNLKAWKAKKAKAESKGKRFHEKPPVPPRQWNRSPVFYAGQWKGFTGSEVLLKLWTGASWCWVKFRLRGREVPIGWEIQSPSLVKTGRSWNLHAPVICEKFAKPEKISEQIKDPDLKICSVDLNINDALAVCVVLKPDGTEVATKFIRGGRFLQHRRKRILGIIATKRVKTGILQEGVQDNARRFKKLRDIDVNEAHQVSHRIVEFCVTHGAKILVFEHLGNFRPQKGRYSARGNEKRTYWLRGKIFQYSKYKAWEQGIVTSRVNPANTSRLCCKCGFEVYRYQYHPDLEHPYQAGAPNFLCQDPWCGAKGNADRGAAVNVGKKLFLRYEQKPTSKDLGVSRSQEAEKRGPRNRRGTYREVPSALRSSGCGYVTVTGGNANARAS